MPPTGTYLQHRKLAGSELPTLVRQQRRLEAKVAALEQFATDEKAVRAQIDVLLLVAGLQKGDVVTCNGYDVVHNERKGQSRINGDILRGAGVPEIDIQLATETGEPSKFATVKPSKGAKVRT